MDLPVVVIGAGPLGLAAAAHLRERGMRPLVLEAGTGPAAAVAQWGHVRLFSRWPELVDGAAMRLLAGRAEVPTTGYPTGAEWIERYLAPLADALGSDVRYATRVVAVGRKGRDRLVDEGRDSEPFVVHVREEGGRERRVEARAVIDASGTWGWPNPVGADGILALGEAAAGDVMVHAIPDRGEADRFAGKHTVVVGSGDSAFNAIAELAAISGRHDGTRVTWAIRRAVQATTFGGGAADQLPRRGALGQHARRAVERGTVELVTGFRTVEVKREGQRAVLVGEDGRALPAADTVVVLNGFRPDLSFLSEMRLDLDPTLEAPRRIAAEIDPNLHSCGSVRATGAADLAQPEPDLYLVGMKSHGRAPTFLALTGYEQVRSVVAALAGDDQAAARVELALSETGGCGGSGSYDDPEGQQAGGCCAPAPLLQIDSVGVAS